MKIEYNVTGSARKALVGAISDIINKPQRYLGAPSFAYEVGGYKIDKTGTVIGPDNRDMVADLQRLHSIVPVSEEYNSSLPEAEEASTFEDLAMTDEEELGLGRQRRDPMGEDGMQASDIPDDDEKCPDIDQHHIGHYANPDAPVTEAMINQVEESLPPEFAGNTDTLTVVIPTYGFTDTVFDNLKKLIASKAELIRKSIGQNLATGADCLPVERSDESIRFPWFRADAVPDDINAYSRFISALCAAAKDCKRVTAKEREVENEKFAFRIFLIRLGFVGSDFKEARKILMRSLSGNSAFRDGAPRRIENASNITTDDDDNTADDADGSTAVENADNIASDDDNDNEIPVIFDQVYIPPEVNGALAEPDIDPEYLNQDFKAAV